MLLDRWDGSLAVTGVALVAAVGEPRCKFSQIALPDCLTAQRTERLRAGCPAIHQDEFHMPFPRKKTPDEEFAEKVHWRTSSLGRSGYAVTLRQAAVAERVRRKPTVNPRSVTEGASHGGRINSKDLRLRIGVCVSQ